MSTGACVLLPPLLGHMIALTGHRRMDELAAHLQRLGGSVLLGGLVHTRPLSEEDRHLRDATAAIVAHPPDFLVATTGLGMRSWFNAAASFGQGDELVQALQGTKILARGPKVVGALSEAGLRPWFVEPSGRTIAMLDLLARQRLEGRHVAMQFPGSPMQNATELVRSFGAQVTTIAVYEWTWPDDLGPPRRLVRAVAERRVSAVTFTSRPAAHNFIELARREGLDDHVGSALRGPVVAVCIGDVTADPLRAAYGAEPVLPARPLLGGIVQVTTDALLARGHHHVLGASGEIVVQRRVVLGAGDTVTMSDREADLLGTLLAEPRRTHGRGELRASVWADEDVDASVLETTIARLRRRLAMTGLNIRTINGRGYLLDGEVVACPRTCDDSPTEPLATSGA